MPKELPAPQDPDALEYEKIASEEPPREIEMPENTAVATTGSKSLSDKLDSSDMTDMQYAAYRLFPPDVASQEASMAMIARIDPDAFLSLLGLRVTEEFMQADTRQCNFIDILQKHYSLMSIGRDGMGRIDLLELAGAARDDKKMQTMAGGMGG